MIVFAIMAYALFLILTSWIFWAMVGAALFLLAFTVSPFVRVVTCTIIACFIIVLWHQI